LKLVDARKVISTYNENNEDEELVYELEKYTEPKPKVMKTVWVKDKDCPNLKLPTRKRV
jgi:hypothetical protein|tara:strand:- start:19 stop:195 length:177 start_codon:yes stop_codon:yes gene_type:complete